MVKVCWATCARAARLDTAPFSLGALLLPRQHTPALLWTTTRSSRRFTTCRIRRWALRDATHEDITVLPVFPLECAPALRRRSTNALTTARWEARRSGDRQDAGHS